MSKLPSEPVNGVPNPKIPMGTANVLAQAPTVVAAFGRPLGFILMILALVPRIALGVGTVAVVLKGVARLMG
jgi:hypothetical protein